MGTASFEESGTVEAHCRIDQGPATIVPFTLLPPTTPTKRGAWAWERRNPRAGDTWGVLIYDGDCGFCRRCADWLRARGDVPMASDGEVDLLAIGLTPEETKTAVWWVEGSDRFSGHQAIGHALRLLGGGWALVGRLIRMPPVSWFAAVAYRWVAPRGSLD